VEDGPRGELVVEEGAEKGRVIPLRPGRAVVIGREGQIRLEDKSLSRTHCEVVFERGRYWLKDKESRWGTFLNDQRIEEVPLSTGDRVKIGSHVLRVDIEEDPPAAPVARAAPAAIPVAGRAEPPASPEPAPATRTPDAMDMASLPRAVAADRHDEPEEDPVPEGACRNCRKPLDREGGYCSNCMDQYPLLGQVIANHRCERVLGAGGMGIVYRAVHAVMGRVAAIKTLRHTGTADPVLVQRLLREATAGGRIQHPAIVSVHDTGEQGTVAYVVMEYVQGENLAQALAREKRFSLRRATWFTLQVAEALAAAFRLGYIHRDIKPENILLRRDDTVKVTDFGLAKNLKEGELGGLTRTGQVLGTMVYIAPEQIVSSKGSDQRADLYSLGATYFHLCAGRPPFDTREPIKLLLQIRKEEPPPLSQVLPGVPEGVERIVTRCLRKDPAERYQSPEELAADLRAVYPSLPA
jgi:hypothetical protein